jgi:hypothetical protein
MSDLSSPPSRGSFWFSTFGIIGCFLLFLIILFIAYIPSRQTEVRGAANLSDEERIAANILTPAERKIRLEELRAREASELDGYAWIDQPNGVVRLSMERAIQLTIEESKAGEGAN